MLVFIGGVEEGRWGVVVCVVVWVLFSGSIFLLYVVVAFPPFQPLTSFSPPSPLGMVSSRGVAIPQSQARWYSEEKAEEKAEATQEETTQETTEEQSSEGEQQQENTGNAEVERLQEKVKEMEKKV